MLLRRCRSRLGGERRSQAGVGGIGGRLVLLTGVKGRELGLTERLAGDLKYLLPSWGGVLIVL